MADHAHAPLIGHRILASVPFMAEAAEIVLCHEERRRFYAPRGVGTVESCTLCVDKVDRGYGITTCAEACLRAGHQAIPFGDLKNPGSETSKRLATEASPPVRADPA
jgi:Fe-S-cluster-containing dehydrogenase component